MSDVRLGGTKTIVFGTSNPTTGAATNADSTPVVTVLQNGTAMAYSPTVTNITTGLYKVDLVCSTGNSFADGDNIAVYATATVGGVTGRDGIASFKIENIENTVWLSNILGYTETPNMAQRLYRSNAHRVEADAYTAFSWTIEIFLNTTVDTIDPQIYQDGVWTFLTVGTDVTYTYDGYTALTLKYSPGLLKPGAEFLFWVEILLESGHSVYEEVYVRVRPYAGRRPRTAAETKAFHGGYGTWVGAYMFDDAGSPLMPSFGSVVLPLERYTGYGTPTYSVLGSLQGDRALSSNTQIQFNSDDTSPIGCDSTDDFAATVLMTVPEVANFYCCPWFLADFVFAELLAPSFFSGDVSWIDPTLPNPSRVLFFDLVSNDTEDFYTVCISDRDLPLRPGDPVLALCVIDRETGRAALTARTMRGEQFTSRRIWKNGAEIVNSIPGLATVTGLPRQVLSAGDGQWRAEGVWIAHGLGAAEGMIDNLESILQTFHLNLVGASDGAGFSAVGEIEDRRATKKPTTIQATFEAHGGRGNWHVGYLLSEPASPLRPCFGAGGDLVATDKSTPAYRINGSLEGEHGVRVLAAPGKTLSSDTTQRGFIAVNGPNADLFKIGVDDDFAITWVGEWPRPETNQSYGGISSYHRNDGTYALGGFSFFSFKYDISGWDWPLLSADAPKGAHTYVCFEMASQVEDDYYTASIHDGMFDVRPGEPCVFTATMDRSTNKLRLAARTLRGTSCASDPDKTLVWLTRLYGSVDTDAVFDADAPLVVGNVGASNEGFYCEGFWISIGEGASTELAANIEDSLNTFVQTMLGGQPHVQEAAAEAARPTRKPTSPLQMKQMFGGQGEWLAGYSMEEGGGPLVPTFGPLPQLTPDPGSSPVVYRANGALTDSVGIAMSTSGIASFTGSYTQSITAADDALITALIQWPPISGEDIYVDYPEIFTFRDGIASIFGMYAGHDDWRWLDPSLGTQVFIAIEIQDRDGRYWVAILPASKFDVRPGETVVVSAVLSRATDTLRLVAQTLRGTSAVSQLYLLDTGPVSTLASDAEATDLTIARCGRFPFDGTTGSTPWTHEGVWVGLGPGVAQGLGDVHVHLQAVSEFCRNLVGEAPLARTVDLAVTQTRDVSRRPKTAEEMFKATAGLGTWTAGYLFNEAGLPLRPAFGSSPEVDTSAGTTVPNFRSPGVLSGDHGVATPHAESYLRSTGTLAAPVLPASDDIALMAIARWPSHEETVAFGPFLGLVTSEEGINFAFGRQDGSWLGHPAGRAIYVELWSSPAPPAALGYALCSVHEEQLDVQPGEPVMLLVTVDRVTDELKLTVRTFRGTQASSTGTYIYDFETEEYALGNLSSEHVMNENDLWVLVGNWKPEADLLQQFDGLWYTIGPGAATALAANHGLALQTFHNHLIAANALDAQTTADAVWQADVTRLSLANPRRPTPFQSLQNAKRQIIRAKPNTSVDYLYDTWNYWPDATSSVVEIYNITSPNVVPLIENTDFVVLNVDSIFKITFLNGFPPGASQLYLTFFEKPGDYATGFFIEQEIVIEAEDDASFHTRRPTSATGTKYAHAGLGTWTTGYLLNEPGSPLLPSFGNGPPLVGSSANVGYHSPGPLPGDHGLMLASGTYLSASSTPFHADAADDIAMTWIGIWPDLDYQEVAFAIDTTSGYTVPGWQLYDYRDQFDGEYSFAPAPVCTMVGFDLYPMSVDAISVIVHDGQLDVRPGEPYIGTVTLDRATDQLRMAIRTFRGAYAESRGFVPNVGFAPLDPAAEFNESTSIVFGGGADGTRIDGFWYAVGPGVATTLSLNLARAQEQFLATLLDEPTRQAREATVRAHTRRPTTASRMQDAMGGLCSNWRMGYLLDEPASPLRPVFGTGPVLSTYSGTPMFRTPGALKGDFGLTIPTPPSSGVGRLIGDDTVAFDVDDDIAITWIMKWPVLAENQGIGSFGTEFDATPAIAPGGWAVYGFRADIEGDEWPLPAGSEPAGVHTFVLFELFTDDSGYYVCSVNDSQLDVQPGEPCMFTFVLDRATGEGRLGVRTFRGQAAISDQVVGFTEEDTAFFTTVTGSFLDGADLYLGVLFSTLGIQLDGLWIGDQVSSVSDVLPALEQFHKTLIGADALDSLGMADAVWTARPSRYLVSGSNQHASDTFGGAAQWRRLGGVHVFDLEAPITLLWEVDPDATLLDFAFFTVDSANAWTNITADVTVVNTGAGWLVTKILAGLSVAGEYLIYMYASSRFGAANGYIDLTQEVVILPGAARAAVVADGGNSSSTFKTSLTDATTDKWKDTYCRFLTGSLAGEVKRVLGYNGTTKVLTTRAFTGTPAATDEFELVNG